MVLVAACDDVRSAGDQSFEPNREGVLTVATALPAPGFWEHGADGDFTGGFEYGIAAALAERFGLELDVVDVPFGDLVVGDLHGADLAMSQISITEARAEAVDFSTTYYETSAGVLAPSGTTVPDLKTARGLSWCVVSGTTEAELVAATIRPSDPPVEVGDDVGCATAVADGTVDAALLDLASAVVLRQQFAGLDAVARFNTDERYGVAMANGDRRLELVDAGLRALDSDGTLTDLAQQYLTPSVDTGRIPVIVTSAD